MASIRALSIVGLLAALLFPVYTWLENNLESFYIFDPKDLHDLANRAITAHGNDTRAIVSYITTELSGRDHLTSFVNLDEEWVFNNAGGAMGAMYIIHASITEYLIIFGTAIGTEGHSGRHTADDYFNILTGTQLAYVPGEYEPEVYPPGSVHHLRRGDVKQYKMDSSCFAMEYARGWIPPMLFFGYADTFSSTLDFPTLWATTRVTGREMIANLLKKKL
ncbi:putative c-8 sterol isomerase (erg-1) protein [Lasiodiplodia theobromae]|uniref:C-8 sterol isomerase n=1 Tax=Lasiodiplodia theobromae TaxID=45133 RepID=A0A5N5D5M6_9PEZI|nr:C-8 sterol isomerase [Lasiodiplodia theobromae]KAB2572654.1 C-8 sterol isomerase [Lasiodiplodia theobromae]KAF4546205.1 C-8 sterol isomerase [Lasiodiplodia theobromae]KAF9630342.1 putative c-8 sterol isomerase (erg-1) protein [Lasiodiplodia theobromae]